jgi:hypothetical protein
MTQKILTVSIQYQLKIQYICAYMKFHTLFILLKDKSDLLLLMFFN